MGQKSFDLLVFLWGVEREDINFVGGFPFNRNLADRGMILIYQVVFAILRKMRDDGLFLELKVSRDIAWGDDFMKGVWKIFFITQFFVF